VIIDQTLKLEESSRTIGPGTAISLKVSAGDANPKKSPGTSLVEPSRQ